jgi:putative isomerase
MVLQPAISPASILAPQASAIVMVLQLLLLLPAAATAPSIGAQQGLRVQYFNNSVLLGEPRCHGPTTIEPSPATYRVPDAAALEARCRGLSPTLFSARFHGQLHLPVGQYQLKTETSGALRLWVHGWKLVDEFDLPAGGSNATRTAIAKYNFTVVTGRAYPVRMDALFTLLPAVVSISYRKVGGGVGWAELPPHTLSSTVDPNELARQRLQSSLSVGWNTWNRASATAHVHLPSAFGFDVTIVDPAMNTSFTRGIVDRCDPPGRPCLVRPGAHTSNGSFTHLDQRVREGLTVAVRSAHVGAAVPSGASRGDATAVLLVANRSGAVPATAVAQLQLKVHSRFYFDCLPRTDSGAVPCGVISAAADGKGLIARPVGLPPVFLRAIGGSVGVTADEQGLLVTFAGAAACLVSSSGAEPQLKALEQCRQAVAEAEARVEAELEARYPRSTVGSERDVVDAIRAVMGWNSMYDHRATVITPVSRSFGQMPFEMWEWDTYFSTLLAAESSKELAYSNLIEITRPTVAGNVPGFRTSQASVQDRSKPYVGAMVLELLFSKFHDKWIVELLWDDMLMWTNWIRDTRLEQPAGLVVLASDNVAPGQSDRHQCTKEAVIWESGLDNSPMYDETEIQWDYPKPADVPIGTSCRFHLYDVGMTGLYLSMLDSLSNLAAEIDRPDDAASLRARHNKTAAALNRWLWNSSLGVYTNVRSRGDNGTSTRISPFNFHPLISGAASVEQAKVMATRWLLTDEGFCLTQNGSAGAATVQGAMLACGGCNVTAGTDAAQPAQQVATPLPLVTAATCCAACQNTTGCEAFVLGGDPQPSSGGVYPTCWRLANVTTVVPAPTGGEHARAFGCVHGRAPHHAPAPPPHPPAPPASPKPCKFGLPSIAHSDHGYDDQSYRLHGLMITIRTLV